MKPGIAGRLFILLALLSGCRTMEGGMANISAQNSGNHAPNPIKWGAVSIEGGAVIVPGSVHADFGRFDFFWQIPEKGAARLMAKEPLGSAEMGLRLVALYPYFPGDGLASIFREHVPLLNSREPRALTLIAVVSADELRAGLALGEAFLKQTAR